MELKSFIVQAPGFVNKFGLFREAKVVIVVMLTKILNAQKSFMLVRGLFSKPFYNSNCKNCCNY